MAPAWPVIATEIRSPAEKLAVCVVSVQSLLDDRLQVIVVAEPFLLTVNVPVVAALAWIVKLPTVPALASGVCAMASLKSPSPNAGIEVFEILAPPEPPPITELELPGVAQPVALPLASMPVAN